MRAVAARFGAGWRESSRKRKTPPKRDLKGAPAAPGEAVQAMLTGGCHRLGGERRTGLRERRVDGISMAREERAFLAHSHDSDAADVQFRRGAALRE